MHQLRLHTLGPGTIDTCAVQQHPAICRLVRPAPFEVQLVVGVAFNRADIAIGLAFASNNTITNRPDLVNGPLFLGVGFVIGNEANPAVEVIAVEQDGFLDGLNRPRLVCCRLDVDVSKFDRGAFTLEANLSFCYRAVSGLVHELAIHVRPDGPADTPYLVNVPLPGFFLVVLTIFDDPSAPGPMPTTLVLVELHSTDRPEITLVAIPTLALQAFGPHAVFADHVDKNPVVPRPSRPAVLDVKLVVFVCLDCTDVAGRLTHTGENTIRLYRPGFIHVALAISQIPKPAVKALAVEKHDLFLRLNRLGGTTYWER